MAWLNGWMLPILDERDLRRLRRAPGNDNAARPALPRLPGPVPRTAAGTEPCRMAAPTPSR